MEKADLLGCLSDCIRKAHDLSRGDMSSESDIYWHTREACVAMARANGVRITELIGLATTGFGPGRPHAFFQEVWPQVAHPSILIQDVMDC